MLEVTFSGVVNRMRLDGKCCSTVVVVVVDVCVDVLFVWYFVLTVKKSTDTQLF